MHTENSFMPKISGWVFALLAILYFSSIRIDVMDVDASQYAEMSREMMNSHNWLHVYDRGMEYLDKPPFLFWVSAASMKVFGVNNLGYKFPSILFALWALYAVYRLTRLLYNEQIARLAALILGTCQGMFLITNDVRTDTILMSCVVTAIWMIKEADIKRKWYYVLGGTTAIACGMMTKGPIALLVPLFCFGSDWVLKRQWKKIFNPYHLLDFLLIAIMLIPMSIGLYQQFDMHPEKVVNGLTHVSGLRFFYWSQSFGRITGESPWNNGAGLDFLFVNMLWSFLPWILLFVAGLITNVVQLFRQRFRLKDHQEFITTGGFLLAYLALGSSHYQLPHYIFVVYPLAAIITAKFVAEVFGEGKYPVLLKVLRPTQVAISAGIFIAVLLILLIVFPVGIGGLMLWDMAVAIWFYILISKRITGKVFWLCAAAIMLGNVFLTHHFYKNLLHYQAGSEVGHYIHDHKIPVENTYWYELDDTHISLSFYARSLILWGGDKLQSGNYILTTNKGLTAIRDKGLQYEVLKSGSFFNVSMIALPFLNPATRDSELKHYYFIRLK